MRMRWLWAVVAIVVALAIAAGVWVARREQEPFAPAGAPSIAALPFVDMSPAKDQEYFADGLAEEVLNRLARTPELRVTGRTSSFQFKGKNEDLRLIAKKLNVASILEGSVRKEGNRVYYRIVDESVFALCEQVCGSLQQQLRALNELVEGVGV